MGVGPIGSSLFFANPTPFLPRSVNFRSPRPSVNPAIQHAERLRLKPLLKKVISAKREIERLQEVFVFRKTSSSGAGSAASFTSMRSTEEINTIPTSFTPINPSFTGTSTAKPTISGTFNGTQDDAYTFKSPNGGTVGKDKIRIEVFDNQGGRIKTINLNTNYQPGTPKNVINGMKVSFSAGTIEKDDQFSLSLSVTVGSSVNPDNPFNGTGSQDPNFDPDVPVVTDGSFTVNGVTINVSSSDSLNSVLNKTTNSAAAVTATFDPVSEKIVLLQKTPGSSNQIILGNDSSGFLEATKLSGAQQILGQDQATRTRTRRRLGSPERVKEHFQKLSRGLNGFFREVNEKGAHPAAISAGASVRSAIETTFDSFFADRSFSTVYDSGFGIRFNFLVDDALEFSFEKLTKTTRLDAEQVSDFLLGDEQAGDKIGLFRALQEKLEEIEESLLPQLDTQGLFLNAFA